jgi:SHS2 domain-containing protein
MKALAPEDIELNKKQAKLERLKERLADREEEMTELRAELDQIEANYKMQVGRLYADLDEIEAQIAEEELKLVPDDEEIKKKVEELRRRAEESAADADAEKWEGCANKWNPTPEAKKTYHNLARLIHPDLAIDADERERRHVLMAKLNDAYADGDQNLLNRLVEEYRDSPDLVRGDAIGDHLVRVIRQLSQVAARLKELKSEKLKLELSELYEMREKVRTEQLEGRNYFNQISARTRTHIMKAQRRLENLKNLNVVQEDYVREKYGLDISEFRK